MTTLFRAFICTAWTQHNAAFKVTEVHLPPQSEDGSATTDVLRCDWLVMNNVRYEVVEYFTLVPQWMHQHSLLISWCYFMLQMATETCEEVNDRRLVGFQPELKHRHQLPATLMHVFLFSWTHQCNSAGKERNDSSSRGEQCFEMQANGPSNSGDILLRNKKNEQQPMTFGEQLGCFASEKNLKKSFSDQEQNDEAFSSLTFQVLFPTLIHFWSQRDPLWSVRHTLSPLSGLHLQPPPASLNGHPQSGAHIFMCTWM